MSTQEQIETKEAELAEVLASQQANRKDLSTAQAAVTAQAFKITMFEHGKNGHKLVVTFVVSNPEPGAAPITRVNTFDEDRHVQAIYAAYQHFLDTLRQQDADLYETRKAELMQEILDLRKQL